MSAPSGCGRRLTRRARLSAGAMARVSILACGPSWRRARSLCGHSLNSAYTSSRRDHHRAARPGEHGRGVMATSKHPLRHPRRPTFTAEVLELFRELEGTPRRRQKAPEFIAKSKRLAALLNLGNEWWAMQRVEYDDPFRPREGLAAHDYWLTVQRVRRQLLEALRVREAQPLNEPTHPAA